ncbi:MAG TPA: family 20 glycosylhydrolase [Fimbriimonadaceae bacterium]|nr:family 20 glycosylhydrolase [Fimbriimonadaceae bacterium]
MLPFLIAAAIQLTPLQSLQQAPALRLGDRIAFFGDSLTWQGGFIDRIDAALKGKHITLLRRGINGAKSTDVRDGVKNLFDQNQAPFVEVILKDKPTAVVLMIGINDVWHGPNGNDLATYENAIRNMADSCRKHAVPLILCTPTVIGENPNDEDSKIDRYAAVIRAISEERKLTLVDTRKAFRTSLRDAKERSGRLTYDGVHLNDAGNAVVADLVAAALAKVYSQFDSSPVLSSLPVVPRATVETQKVSIDADSTVSSSLDLRGVAAVLRRDLKVLPEEPRATARIEIAVTSRERAKGEESFTVSVTPQKVTIEGGSAQGVTWGITTLIQEAHKGDGKLPVGSWTDKPQFPFRGLLLDVARKPHSDTTVLEIIELCRLYRIRYLQLHLTDDQAFTFPSKSFPKIVTEGHSYARQEIVEMVQFAKDRGVTIIPEIEMPGHCGQLVSKMPELFRAHEKHHATINFASPKVLQAMDTLIAEVCELFPDSPYVHIGGDEADLTHVHENPDFQEAFKREGVENARELYRKFFGRMKAVVERHKKEMLVWEGFGPDGKVPVSKDLLVMNYEAAYYTPDRMAADGYRMINASWQPLYVVNQRNWSTEEIYAWNPWYWKNWIEGYPAFNGIQLGPDAKIEGSIMCAWEQPAAVELSSLRRRLPAMAERVWNASYRGSYAEFATRLDNSDSLLTKILSVK